MKLKSVEIENYRAIDELRLPLHPSLTVLHGDNAHGKTSVLSAIAVALGRIPMLLPDVSGIDFRKTDRRAPNRPLRVAVTTTEGVEWERLVQAGRLTRRRLSRGLMEKTEAIVSADREKREPLDLPIVAFYDTDRAVFDAPQRRRGFTPDFSRYQALEGALSARTNFREFFKWFYAMENEELRAQKQQRDFGYRLKELEAVRRAITAMVPEVSDPRVELGPLRFVVSVTPGRSQSEELALDQLSGGYRIMLAVAADLARRMAQGNAHLDDPLASEAIVLIDEVELHLHPSWQQRVLTDLARTFPNTQFIVSTAGTSGPQPAAADHPPPGADCEAQPPRFRTAASSPGGRRNPPTGQRPQLPRCAKRRDGRAGTTERAANEFVETLQSYMRLVSSGQGETTEALSLRRARNSRTSRRETPHLTGPISRFGGRGF